MSACEPSLICAACLQVVDNSSAFRMSEGVPLVIPEVNADAMAGMRAGQGGIVANPNCSTIIALMAVTPLHRAARVKRMVVSTYQVLALHCCRLLFRQQGRPGHR